MKTVSLLLLCVYLMGCESGKSNGPNTIQSCNDSSVQGTWVDTSDPTHILILDSECKITSSKFGQYTSYPAGMQVGVMNDIPLTYFDDPTVPPSAPGLYDTPQPMVCDIILNALTLTFDCYSPTIGFLSYLELVRQ